MAMQVPAGSPRSDLIPPYSEEAERGVLGSALMDSARVVDLCIQEGVRMDAFHVEAHRLIFESLENMINEGKPVDILTVSQYLQTQNRLDRVGGVPYLEQILESTPTSAHADYYIKIVRGKYLLRKIIDRSREAIEKCYGDADEPKNILQETEEAFFQIGDVSHQAVAPWSDLVKDSMTEIENIYQNKAGMTGLYTGFRDLDQKLLGLHSGDMIIVAARPSMGKTSLAMNIAENIALGKGGDHSSRAVAIFSLEMSREQLVRRMICSHAHVSSHKLSSGYISGVNHGQLMQAADALMKAPIYLDDSAGLTALDIRARARRLKRMCKIDLIVVDYLQMVHFPQYAREGRQREVAAISSAMKAMAKELRVPVLVLSQLSRAPETRDRLAIPKLSDLRDSGSIEQDADVVGLLRRPCKYPDDKDAEDKTLAILDIAKHRNGPTGEITLHFDEEFTRFGDRAHGVDADYSYAEAPEGAEA